MQYSAKVIPPGTAPHHLQWPSTKATLLPSLWRPGSVKLVAESDSLPAIWFSLVGSASPLAASAH